MNSKLHVAYVSPHMDLHLKGEVIMPPPLPANQGICWKTYLSASSLTRGIQGATIPAVSTRLGTKLVMLKSSSILRALIS